jgi:hypothetical protein
MIFMAVAFTLFGSPGESEGSGEFAAKERSRFYRMARRSAAEAGAALDELEDLGVRTPAETAPAHKLTVRVVGLLISSDPVNRNTNARSPVALTRVTRSGFSAALRHPGPCVAYRAGDRLPPVHVDITATRAVCPFTCTLP